MQTFKQFIQEQGTVGGPMGINASGQLGASPMAPPKMQTKSVPPGPISLGTKNTKPAAGKMGLGIKGLRSVPAGFMGGQKASKRTPGIMGDLKGVKPSGGIMGSLKTK
jgi:hypothetical protein